MHQDAQRLRRRAACLAAGRLAAGRLADALLAGFLAADFFFGVLFGIAERALLEV